MMTPATRRRKELRKRESHWGRDRKELPAPEFARIQEVSEFFRIPLRDREGILCRSPYTELIEQTVANVESVHSIVPDSLPGTGNGIEKIVWNFGGVRKH